MALGGTSYAAIKLPANSVGTKQLKRSAVTGVKVKRNTLTGTQINESRLGRVPSAATAGSASTATTAGSAPVSRLDYSASNTFPISAGGSAHLSATCPTGLNATGGGAKVSDSVNGFINDSNPVGKTGWEATGFSTTAQNMTVYVICAQAATTTP